MDRRSFVRGAVALPLAARTAMLPGVEGDKHSEARGGVLAGFSGANGEPLLDRYHLTLARVLHGEGPAYTPEFLLEDIRATQGRRFTNFSGDVSGRWIGALSASSSTFGESFPVLGDVVARVIALQHDDGYFGKNFNYDHPGDDDLALLWGNGRLLVGLMEYHAVAADPAVLAAGVKLGDFLLRIGPQFNSQKMADAFGSAHFASSYICWTQQTEGLAALYAATHDVRYRDLCAEISRRIVRRPGDHVHGYLCSVRGTLDLYTATGDDAHLERAVAAWKDVMTSGDVLITGGVPEAWTPKKLRTEGCAECDWLRLNLALYRATGDAAYLDMAEKVHFNEFAMNQFDTGDFGHARLNESGTPGIVYVRAWWCCTLHGLRAFADVRNSVFRSKGSQAFYDLPLDGRVAANGFTARATSRLADDGTVEIRVGTAPKGQTLTVRKPPWATSITLTRNGHNISGLSAEDVGAGDVFGIRYEMKQRVARGGNAEMLVSLHYGPWLLGAASSVNAKYFNELHAENKLMLGIEEGSAKTVATPFAVAVAATRVGYVPAEFPVQPSQVELRAVAEQTGMGPTDWQMLFAVKEKA